MTYEPQDLSILRSIVTDSKAPVEQRQDFRDAVGQASISKSEEWLSNNSKLDRTAKYTKWMTEVRPEFRVTPINKEYFWATQAKLHPKGEKAAEQDYLNNVYNKLNTLDDLGKKAHLQDIAREAPPSVLNHLLLDMRVLDQKSQAKTQERARLANIHEFDRMSSGLVQQMFEGKMVGLNPEVSSFSHGEDLAKAWGYNRDDIFVDDNGRIAITTEQGIPAPVWSLEDSALTWEEAAINAHDLVPISRRKVKKALQYTRSNARNADRLATLELGKNVQSQPKEFQASIAIDYAELSGDPMGSLKESVNKIVEANLNDGYYRSVKDLIRDYLGTWKDITKTLTLRGSDGTVEHTGGLKNV